MKLFMRSLFLAGAVFLNAVGGGVQAEEGNYKVKAVFLFKFFKYINWPTEVTGQKNICVYGANPFGSTLDYIIKTKLSPDEYKVSYMNDLTGAGKCQLIFFSRSRPEKMDGLSEAAALHKSILTVSDREGFAGKGGGIEFVDHPNKIGLLLNTEAFRQAGLNASSKLMKIVKTVKN